MDKRLLELYETELTHLRGDMAKEFVKRRPTIAGRLLLGAADKPSDDPLVEHLLEGFAFLTARVQLKMEREFSRFAQSLIETIYPQFLCPTPSMAILRFEPKLKDADLAIGPIIEREEALAGTAVRDTPCKFRTGHSVRLWPLRVKEAQYTEALTGFDPPAGAKSAIRMRLETTAAGLTFQAFKENLDCLAFYIDAAEFSGAVYQQIFTSARVFEGSGARMMSVWSTETKDKKSKQLDVLGPSSIRALGFGPDEALLPVAPRGFEGYRLLREYFAFRQRFLFFEVTDLRDAVKACGANELDLVIFLVHNDPRLEPRINESWFRLFCTPAINLFNRSIALQMNSRMASALIPQGEDFEIFDIASAEADLKEPSGKLPLRPFFRERQAVADQVGAYTAHRVVRTEGAQRDSDYLGTELSIALHLKDEELERLSGLGIEALCTNRGLPPEMPLSDPNKPDTTDFTLLSQKPQAWVQSVRCLGRPTRPLLPPGDHEHAWNVISHLCLNHTPMIGREGGAAAVKEMLRLYSPPDSRQFERQIDGLVSARYEPMVSRIDLARWLNHCSGQRAGEPSTPVLENPVSFARGLRVTLQFDDDAFVGTDAFLLGAVLERFFAKYVSLNSFTQTIIQTTRREEVIQWPIRLGARAQV